VTWLLVAALVAAFFWWTRERPASKLSDDQLRNRIQWTRDIIAHPRFSGLTEERQEKVRSQRDEAAAEGVVRLHRLREKWRAR
jgi:hypothetical protein